MWLNGKIFRLISLLIIILIVVCFVKSIENSVWYKSSNLISPFLIVFLWLLSWFILKIGEKIWQSINFYWDVRKLRNYLDGNSLSILAKSHRGLPFSFSQSLGNSEIRHLITLKIIRTIVFPRTIDFCYLFTDIGRYLLEKDLKFQLYPEILSDIILNEFWRGYREIDKQKYYFERKYSISWERSRAMLQDRLKDLGLQYSDVVNMFSIYINNKKGDIAAIMDEVIVPWIEQINKERKPISFCLYGKLRYIKN